MQEIHYATHAHAEFVMLRTACTQALPGSLHPEESKVDEAVKAPVTPADFYTHVREELFTRCPSEGVSTRILDQKSEVAEICGWGV